jgi:hypothetical protein
MKKVVAKWLTSCEKKDKLINVDPSPTHDPLAECKKLKVLSVFCHSYNLLEYFNWLLESFGGMPGENTRRTSTFSAKALRCNAVFAVIDKITCSVAEACIFKLKSFAFVLYRPVYLIQHRHLWYIYYFNISGRVASYLQHEQPCCETS